MQRADSSEHEEHPQLLTWTCSCFTHVVSQLWDFEIEIKVTLLPKLRAGLVPKVRPVPSGCTERLHSPFAWQLLFFKGRWL